MRPLSPTTLAVATLLACLSSCARAPQIAGESVILDEPLVLARGESLDSASRDLVAPVEGTCVAIIEEDDADSTLGLETSANGAATSKVEVKAESLGEFIEVAAISVVRGSKLTVSASTPPDMLTPARPRVRVVCYAADAQSPKIRARVEAYRAWSEASLRDASKSEESNAHQRDLMALAVARLDSPDGDPHMAAWAHLINGNLLRGTLPDAQVILAELRVAENAFSALKEPEPRNVARSRFAIAATLADVLNDGTSKDPTPEEAKIEARRLLSELSAPSSPLSAVEKARAVKYLGYICFQLADYDCATHYFDLAADAFHKVGSRRDELSVLHNLAVTANDLGNFPTAIKYFDRLLPLLHKNYSPERYGQYHFNGGVAYANYGDTTKAVTNLLIALESARERESAPEIGRAMYGLGIAYWRRGDLQQANTFFEESLKQRRLANDGTGLINSLAVVGRFSRIQGRLDEALAMHREALEHASTSDMKMRAKYELALDYSATKQFDRAIAVCREALKEGSGNPPRRAQTQLVLAETLIARKPDAAALTEAETLVRAVLKMATDGSDTAVEVNARHVLAKILALRGDRASARREYETAIAVILDFRGSSASPELQATSVAHEEGTFREYVDLLMSSAVARGAGRFSSASRDEEDALRVLELARSSGRSAPHDVGVDSATQKKIDDLLQQMAAKRVRIASLNDRTTPGGNTADVVELEMSRLRAEVDQLRGGSADFTRPTKLPKAVNRPWPPIATGVTQLSYALGGRNAYLWVRDAAGLRVAVLADSSAQIERSLAELEGLDQIHSATLLEQALENLSAGLLPPGTLDDASSSLEVVAEGSLGTLPYAALRDPKNGKRVVELHDVRMITSMFDTSAAAPDKPPAMAFLGIASSTGRLRSAAHVFPALDAARAEARTIANMFGGATDAAHVKLLTAADGDAETIKALWAGGAAAVHFATHGLANLRYPSASLLLLPKGSGPIGDEIKGDSEESAYLTAGQVQEWRGNVGLVFLAACETAAGPARFAEGMSGLPRSFLSAGARGIVATLWSVEDVYESEFSVDFYRRFIVSRNAESALSETQREWLKPRAGEKPAEYDQRLVTSWAHVFHARPK